MTPETPSFVPGRRWRVGFSVAASVVAAIVLVGLVNHVAITRRVWRYDLTQGQALRLSPLTVQTLAALTNEVRVTVLFSRESALYPHVDTLLREYESRSPRVLIQRIDPIRSPALARLKKSEFKLGSKGGNAVVFESGSRLRVVPEEDLSIYNSDDIQALVHGGHNEIRRSAFTGENRFTSAIAALLDGTQAHAVYLTGHGEPPWDGENSGVGFADFDRLLRGEKNLRVDPWNLITADLPADIQLVIIPGPTSQFLPIELSRIEGYLRHGGRLLVAMNAEAVAGRTGLEELLFRWAVVCPQMIAGEGNKLYVRNGFDVLSKTFGTHVLMAPLRHAETQLYFPFPRVVSPVDPRALPPDAARAEILVTTTEQGLTRSDFRGGNAAFNAEGGDQKNRAIPLAVAAEKGGVTGVAAGRGAARLVVLGDSAMLCNGFIDNVGNRDFAGLCVSWLLDRPQSLAIGPRPLREWRLSLSGRQLNLLQWSLLGGLPGGVLALGLVIWSRRRA